MGWIPAAAAAAKRRREEREESELIERLRNRDPEGLFEFKILRSFTFAFAGEGRMRAVLDEEAKAGWELAEKLDSRRLALRRPRSMREWDHQLPARVDPYRTTVGLNLPLITASVVVGLLLCALLWGTDPRATTPFVLVILVLAALAIGVFTLRTRLRK